MQNTNGEKLQNVIGDNLFPEVHHISDIKQVIEELQGKAQNLTQEQIKAIILLDSLGSNEYLHGKDNPYKGLRDFIMEGKTHVAEPDYYIKVIEALIPKPPKPIIMAEKEKGGK